MYENIVDTIMSVSDNLKNVSDEASESQESCAAPAYPNREICQTKTENGDEKKIENEKDGQESKEGSDWGISSWFGGGNSSDVKNEDIDKKSEDVDNESGIFKWFEDLTKSEPEAPKDAWKCIYHTGDEEAEGKAFKKLTSKTVKSEDDGSEYEELLGKQKFTNLKFQKFKIICKIKKMVFVII